MLKKIIILFTFLSMVSFSTEIKFQKIYSNTLKFEGKTYIKNNIEESKYGISKYYTKDVKNLTEEKAFKIAYKKIYKNHKIDKINNNKIQIFVFDFIYNTSPKNAITIIQKTVDVKITGNMNEETILALNNFSDKKLLLYILKNNRIEYLKSLKHYEKYKKGWNYRVQNIC